MTPVEANSVVFNSLQLHESIRFRDGSIG